MDASFIARSAPAGAPPTLVWLARRFILRQLAREPVRAWGTVLGVALGVAVVIAIRLANTSSVRGFEAALESIAGQTSLEIVGPAPGLDEAMLAGLGWLREFGAVSPVIEGDALFRAGPGRVELLRVLGVDMLRDQPFRDYDVLELTSDGGKPSSRALLDLLLHPRAVVVTERFARRYGLRTGDAVTLTIGDREDRFVIGGRLREIGPARALDGNVALMDIAAAQWVFARLGRVDRLDVRLDDPAGSTAPSRRSRRNCPRVSRFSDRCSAVGRSNACSRRSS